MGSIVSKSVRKKIKKGMRAGKLRIADHWNAISIIAKSQTNPLKAVAEFVENSIDARSKQIVIMRGKKKGEFYLKISDDGEGIPKDKQGLPDFRRVATHICDSIKQIAKKAGIAMGGPVPLPTKKLKITTRKSPCGDGTATFDNFEMRIHKRLIDLPANEKVLHQIMRMQIPKNVNIKIEMRD